ncbi:MAG: hypothetical protein IPL23_21525 [Saprospiraceae bacterium]|nr:hypothetical protein [Saprospiraceae bacterium]
MYSKKKNHSNDEIPDIFPRIDQMVIEKVSIFAEGGASKGCIQNMPCELIENNADLLKTFIKNYIHHWQLSSDFEKWVDESCIFCNTLEDRIVPGVSKTIYRQLKKRWDMQTSSLQKVSPTTFL